MWLRALAAVAVLLAVVLAVGLGWLLRDRAAVGRRVLAIFRRPERAAVPPASEHYYRPYWS